MSPEREAEHFVVEAPFPPDDRSLGYERGSSAPKAWDEATTAAAIEAAGYITAHLGELSGARAKDSDRAVKVRAFCDLLVERAFRRPLAGSERTTYVEGPLDRAPDLETGVRRVVLLTLKSPRFLYLDLGGDRPDAYSVASRLSFALWDSLPDSQLLDAVASGKLFTQDRVIQQAERMLDDVRTRSKLRQFLLQWLQVEPAPELSKNKKLYPELTEGFVLDLRESLDLFLEDVVWGESSDFRQLLLSSDFFMNGRVGRYYGFDIPAEAPFQKIQANRSQRAGVLSHPYLLARFAYTDTSSPIHRGVFLLRSVLGRALRPPPEAFTPLAPDLHPSLSTRERVALQTQPKACQACHGMINPLGFALEGFDAVGRWREEENGKAIDATGFYEPPSGETQKFCGARELAETLAGSDEVQRAFVVKLFHELVKQPVLAFGSRTPEALRQDFAAGGFSVRKLMVRIAVTAALSDVDFYSGYPLPIPPELRRKS